MLDISFLLNRLSSKIIRRHISFTSLPDIDGIMLLKDQKSLPGGCLFIACGEELGEVLNGISIVAPVTILTSGDYGELPEAENIRNVNLIATSLDIFDLYNDINDYLKNCRSFSAALMKAICEGRDLKYVINLAGNMLKAPVFLLNTEYEVIFSNTDYLINDIIIDEILCKGCLSSDAAVKLFGVKCTDPEENSRSASKISRNTYNTEKIKYKGNDIAVLLAITSQERSSVDIANLLTQMAGIISRFLLHESFGNLGTNNIFTGVLNDIVELKLTEADEIENQLKFAHYPIDTFVSCIVIQFNEKDVQHLPYNFIISQLEQILPGNNITVYNGDIVILYSYKERTWHFNLDYEKFEALLARYDAYAGMSNGTRYRNMIRTMYLLAKSTVRLGRLLRKDNLKRIFTHEEYSMYSIIDLCAKNFYEIYKHNDIIYLSHPAVIALARYDRKNNTNLRDILFCYLINDRNLIKTSKALFMHRNTLLNKINKITDIVGESLDNGRLQLRLLFSCLLTRYYEEYMKENIASDNS